MSEHPEQQEGEVYLGNFQDEGWQHVGWKTKRLGCRSYESNGTPMPASWGYRPGFAKVEETGGSM